MSARDERVAAQDHGPCQRVGNDPSSAPRGASANSGNPLKGSGRVPPAATGREWDSLSVDEKVERLNYTLSTLASWLASAQTGFGNQDVLGIWNLLHHGSAKDVGE